MSGLQKRMALAFEDAEVERAWRVHRDDSARGGVRAGMLAFGALIVLAGLGDEWQGYDGWSTVLPIRFVLWGPLMVLGAVLVSLPRLRGRVLDITFGVTVATTLSLIATMCFVLPRSAAIDYPMYWAVLLLLVHVVAPLGLARASLAGALVVAGYFATMLRHDAVGDAHFAAHTVFLLVAWAMLGAASWLLESSARAAFLAQSHLRARTAELDALTRLQASVLDALSEGVCGVDADGVVTFANPAATSLLARPVAAIVGARFHAAFHLPDAPDAPDAPGAPDASGPCALCAASTSAQDVPARLALPGGGVRWVECSVRPCQSGDAAGARVISFRDVGRRRELEAQIRHVQKMEAIDRFVGGVAHEFNNLLTPILGGVELTSASLDPSHPLQKRLASVSSAGERAAALVRQLLALGRRTELAPRALDLSAVVTEALDFIQPTMDRRITVRFEPSPDAWAQADPGHVHQILLNLCLNARDALLSDLDGGRPARIDISLRHVELDATAAAADPGARPGRFIELAVADTGPGIPADVLPRVFEPFFTTKAKGRGSGLGLAVLHGMVHQNGGWVSVETSVGVGTRFRCTFPTASPPGPSREVVAPRPALSTGTGPRRVMLIDDEHVVRDVTQAGLEFVGYTVEAFSGGRAALARLEAGQRPDAVVLDVLMPDLDGWAVLARIRALDETLPVVMITGFDASGDAPHAHAPDAVVRKPFQVRHLASVLDRLLRPGGPRSPGDGTRPGTPG